jgi:hypothetical protein
MNISKHNLDYLYEEIVIDYGEWIEMGQQVEPILIALLHKEREKSYELSIKVSYLERLVNS